VTTDPCNLSLSLFFSYLALISEKPCGCCSSLPMSLSFHYLSLILKRPCGCCSLRTLSLSLSQSIICLLFLNTLWLLLLTSPVSVSLSPSIFCLLFQRDPAAAAPYGPCLWISPSVICLLFQRNLVAAALHFLCLSPSIICLLFRETLWRMGHVSVSFSYCYLSLVSERPCGCCSFVGKRGNGPQAISIGKWNKTDINK
jgi:hypothetical protein